jgi:general secretion pathway protein G
MFRPGHRRPGSTACRIANGSEMIQRTTTALTGWPHRAGFTLIELVIVMATIALLLTLALPRYFHAVDKGKLSVQRQNIATLRDAIDKFHGDQARYPDSLEELVQKKYLRGVPIDPLTRLPDWKSIPPRDESLSGVYDVRSAWKAKDETATGG